MDFILSVTDRWPYLARVLDAMVTAWPEHAKFLATRFANADDPTLPICEEVAGLVLTIASGDLAPYCAGYRWFCEASVIEDVHFRRTGRYRRSTFAEVYRDIYSDAAYMDRYMKGLLLSQILWTNHARAFLFYLDRFLARVPSGGDYLEVGPGHGLLLRFAANAPAVRSVTGWDVSDSSLAATRAMLDALGVTRPITLQRHDIHQPAPAGVAFDAIAVSEVLEHLEQPEDALVRLRALLRPGGVIYANVPVNSPAPDHIFLWRDPAEVEALVTACGFTIVDREAAPATGYDLRRAMDSRYTVNCLIVARA